MSAHALIPVDDDPDTRGFFDAAREHRLVIRICGDCGANLHMPRAFCHHCRRFDGRWKEVRGLGTLFTWTVVEHQVHPAYEVPYAIVVVTLEDAPDVRLVGSIAGRPLLREGMPMEVCWQQLPEGVVMPNWKVVATGDR